MAIVDVLDSGFRSLSESESCHHDGCQSRLISQRSHHCASGLMSV